MMGMTMFSALSYDCFHLQHLHLICSLCKCHWWFFVTFKLIRSLSIVIGNNSNATNIILVQVHYHFYTTIMSAVCFVTLVTAVKLDFATHHPQIIWITYRSETILSRVLS